MKYKPNNLTLRFAHYSAAVSAVAAMMVSLSATLATQDAAPDPAAQPDAAATGVATELDALDVLKGVRDRLESLQFLQCSLYETVNLSNLRFYANGRYAQASGNRVRLELKTYPIRGVRQTDAATLGLQGEPEDTGKQEPTGELTQVCDGNALWSYWKNGDFTRLTRRNIQEILKVADLAEDFESKQMLEDLGAGGLQSLIARLQVGMEFGKVREQQAGESRLFVISGRWTAQSLEQYFDLKDPTAALPTWLPEYVRVYVDAEAMMPRRIQYLKKHPSPEVKQVRPIITLDFRGMTVNDAFDESQFKFEAPAGEEVTDLTEPTITAIQNAANPQAAPAADTDSADAPADPAASEDSDN